MYSIPHEYLEVPEDIAALPDISGYGNLHDLQQALVREANGELRALLDQYMAEKDPAARGQIFNDLLFEWAGVEGVAVNSRVNNANGRQLAFLETLPIKYVQLL